MRGIRFPHMLVSEDPRPVWVCQHQPASSFRDMKTFSFSLTVILNLRVLYLILCSQTANSFFYMPKTGQSRSWGKSKHISEWEVIISHQILLPANCCQKLAWAALPVSSYTQPWPRAQLLFWGLPLFLKTAWTGEDMNIKLTDAFAALQLLDKRGNLLMKHEQHL